MTRVTATRVYLHGGGVTREDHPEPRRPQLGAEVAVARARTSTQRELGRGGVVAELESGYRYRL